MASQRAGGTSYPPPSFHLVQNSHGQLVQWAVCLWTGTLRLSTIAYMQPTGGDWLQFCSLGLGLAHNLNKTVLKVPGSVEA